MQSIWPLNHHQLGHETSPNINGSGSLLKLPENEPDRYLGSLAFGIKGVRLIC
jgi:hypothetical protein